MLFLKTVGKTAVFFLEIISENKEDSTTVSGGRFLRGTNPAN